MYTTLFHNTLIQVYNNFTNYIYLLMYHIISHLPLNVNINSAYFLIISTAYSKFYCFTLFTLTYQLYNIISQITLYNPLDILHTYLLNNLTIN